MPLSRSAFRPWLVKTARELLRGHAIAILGLALLLHQSLVALDAFGRSLLRVFVTRRRLLEWETAAQVETSSRSKAPVDRYLDYTPGLALGNRFRALGRTPGSVPDSAPGSRLVVRLLVHRSLVGPRSRLTGARSAGRRRRVAKGYGRTRLAILPRLELGVHQLADSG